MKTRFWSMLALAAVGCSMSVSRELELRLEESSYMVHIGCDSWQRCEDGTRDCNRVEDEVVAELRATGSVVIEAEPSSSEVRSTYYWFIDADGGGDHYWLEATDVDDDCDGCGWRHRYFEAGELLYRDTLQLRLDDGELTRFDQWPDRSDELCAWP